jgi:hypothetical protein
VFNVNGKKSGIVFMPDPNGNEYAISGCRFGNVKGDVHLEGGFRAGTIPLMIESWSDTQITGKLNPALVGEPDQDNVSLVIVPIGGALTRVPGFRFYAAREVVVLQKFPQSAVKLASITDSDGKSVPANFSSPFSSAVNGQPTGSFTGGVGRSGEYRFSPGTDIWDLSGLAPGFEPRSFRFGYWTFDGCLVGILPAEETLYNDGKWSARWDPQNSKQIIVDFAELHCHRSQSLMQLEDDFSDSEYALTISVVGPKGVSPF